MNNRLMYVLSIVLLTAATQIFTAAAGTQGAIAAAKTNTPPAALKFNINPEEKKRQEAALEELTKLYMAAQQKNNFDKNNFGIFILALYESYFAHEVATAQACFSADLTKNIIYSQGKKFSQFKLAYIDIINLLEKHLPTNAFENSLYANASHGTVIRSFHKLVNPAFNT